MIWFRARKARGASRAATPPIFCDLRVRTERPLERDTLSRIVIHVFRGDDCIGRVPVFDPSIERAEKVVRGIGRARPVYPITERICAGAATAVSHSRDHEETIEILDVFVGAEFAAHVVIVIDVVLR